MLGALDRRRRYNCQVKHSSKHVKYVDYKQLNMLLRMRTAFRDRFKFDVL